MPVNLLLAALEVVAAIGIDLSEQLLRAIDTCGVQRGVPAISRLRKENYLNTSVLYIFIDSCWNS